MTVKSKFLSRKRKIGYDVGFVKDEYGCNSYKCECAHFDHTFIGKLNASSLNLTKYSGDIAVSRKTAHKLMKISGDSNTAMWGAYPDSRVDLWDQNVVNGEFVIAYEINPGLDYKLQNMLPEVGLQNLMQKVVEHFPGYITCRLFGIS